jgi:hypothetical protein
MIQVQKAVGWMWGSGAWGRESGVIAGGVHSLDFDI